MSLRDDIIECDSNVMLERDSQFLNAFSLIVVQFAGILIVLSFLQFENIVTPRAFSAQNLPNVNVVHDVQSENIES